MSCNKGLLRRLSFVSEGVREKVRDLMCFNFVKLLAEIWSRWSKSKFEKKKNKVIKLMC
jgi:phosphomannomutase